MKMFYKKGKISIVMMVILSMLLQIVGPVVGDYVYANEQEAFSFQVVQQEDGSGRFEWKYNPDKADGERDFEVDLGLKLNDDFPGLLEDTETGNVIGSFVIYKDGMLKANIYGVEAEVEEPEETEESNELAKMVEILENKVVLNLEVDESLEGETAKVEILNEDGNLVDEAEVLVEGNLVRAEFEDLEPGKYLMKVTIGEGFQVEEEFEIEEADEIEEEEEEVEESEEDENEEDKATEEEPENLEEASVFGEIKLAMATGWESLGGPLVAEAEEAEEAEESSGIGFIPLRFMPGNGGDGRDLSKEPEFDYGIYFYGKVDVDGNPILSSKIEDREINIEELVDLDELFFGVEFKDTENFTFEDGDYLDINIAPLLALEGFDDLENLEGKVDIKLNGKTFAQYWVQDKKLRVEFTNAGNAKGATEIFYNIGFEIKEIIKNGSIIEKIEFEELADKTFTIRRKNIDTGETNTKSGKYDNNDDTITWTIDVNKHLKDLGESTLTDIIPEEFKVSEVRVYDLDIYLDGGDLKEKVEEPGKEEDVSKIWSNEKRELKIPLGKLDKIAKRVIIKAKIVGDRYGELEIKNIAKLNSTEDIPGTTGIFTRQGSLTKKADWVQGTNKIIWTVEYRGTGSGEYTITDTPELQANVGLILDKSSVKVRKGSSFLTYDKDNNVEVKDKEIIFKNLPNDDTDLKVLEYITELVYNTDAGVSEDGKVTQEYIIKNTVKDSNNNKGSAEKKIIRGVNLAKENGKIYGKADGLSYVDWTITIDPKGEKWKDVEIWEYIPEGMEFVEINQTELFEPTVGLKKDDKGNDYKEIKLKAGKTIDSVVKIIITTKINADTNLGTLGDLENKATIKWKPDSKGGIGVGEGWGGDHLEKDVSDKYEVSEYSYRLSKDGTGVSLPYETDTGRKLSRAGWKFTYESFKSSMEGHVIKDTLNNYSGDKEGSHKYDEDSFKVTFDGGETYTGISATENGNIEGLNYKLEVNEDVGDKKGFTFTILGGTKVEKDHYNRIGLKYDTTFDLSQMKEPEKGTEIVLNNELKITKGADELIKANGKNPINSVVSYNGKKKGSYEEGTRKFTWKAELNHKGKTIGVGSVIKDELIGELRDEDTDKIIGGQKYLFGEDEFMIYKASLNKDKDNDNELIKGEPLSLGSDYEFVDYVDHDEKGPIEYETDKGDMYHKGLGIKFLKPIESPLIIEYKTEAVGKSIGKYGNKITMFGKEYEDKIIYDEWEEFIDKKAVIEENQKIYKGDILDWEIVVNKSLSKIYDFELTDTMGDGLIFLKSTLEVKKGSKDGPRAEAEFDINDQYTDDADGRKGFKIRSKSDSDPKFIEDKYIVSYQTLVNTNIGPGAINNKAKISGKSLKEGLGEVVECETSSRRSAGATGGGGNYKIEIAKVKEDGTTAITLPAKFKLITEVSIPGEDKITIEDDDIGETGIGNIVLNLGNKKYYKYYIQEMVAPRGYSLITKEDTENETGPFAGWEWVEGKAGEEGAARKEVDLSNETVKNIKIPVPNKKATEDVVATKKWEGGPKADIWFKLYKKIGNEDAVAVEEIKKLEKGVLEVTWKDLDTHDDQGNVYIYTVQEVDGSGNDFVPENYTKEEEEGLIVTNTYKSPKTEVTGIKKWIGGPTEKPTIELQLYRDGVALEGNEYKVELDGRETPSWSHTWENLDLTDINGIEYVYEVDEVEVPTYYEKSYDNNSLTVINTYESPIKGVKVNKEWKNGEFNRPNFIELQLYRQSDSQDKEKVGSPVRLEKGKPHYIWEDQPVNDNNGNEYTYTVEEVNVPDNYTSAVDGLKVTNTYVIPKTSVKGTKV